MCFGDISPVLEESIQRRIESGKHLGFIIGIVDVEGPRYYGFGRASPEDNNAPNKNTVYEIGSIGKTFTATVLADMVSKGEVRLDDPVQDYLSEVVTLPDYDGKRITLEDLATHRSGLPRMPSNFSPADPLNPFADYAVQDLYDFLNNHQLQRAPGETRLYSNLGFGLLGHVLGLEAGKDYESLVDGRILSSLGMDSTGVRLSESMQKRVAPPHAYHAGQMLAVKHWDASSCWSRCLALDYARYAALLAGADRARRHTAQGGSGPNPAIAR